MARATCKVRLDRFVPDLSGYTKVKDGAPVQAILAAKAAKVKASADLQSKGSHKVVHKRGKFDMGYVVAADDYEARRDQAKRKTLTKACNSIGGGS